MYPNKPVYLMSTTTGTGAEGYAELLKSFHALSSSNGNSALTYQNYNVATTAVAGTGWALGYPVTNIAQPTLPDTFGNGFAIVLELQSFSNRNDTILSGISTLNSQVYFTATIYNGTTAGGQVTIGGAGGAGPDIVADFFAQMDMILVLVDGILTAKF